MAQTKERQASSLTLAARKAGADALVFQELRAKAAGNSPGSLPAGLPAPSPDTLPVPPRSSAAAILGPPLSIRQVADLIGCSPWTVRQKLLPKGLPYFRSAASGRLIFYEVQVVRWIEKMQGGKH
jgi:hypothetical protein